MTRSPPASCADKRHDTIIVPIFGMPVPFHISMLKNCSIAPEEDYTYLRLNFTHPGSQIIKDGNQFPNPLADFVKELCVLFFLFEV